MISMIIAAVLGRRPAAASWSNETEERKKALFSYLRQSVAVLVWDNIARGTSIGCPHIEAALTATEISDRVLSVSRVETVPATTVQIFTGNAITARADMASRSFIVPLNVNWPDPENRNFQHADPLAWTQANRAKILRALYTILIGGALRRPEGQTAKTRFKVWWALVGWPMEYAAELLDIKLDCTELMRSNASKEEEASAASQVLTILRKHWSGNTFTTRDVVRVLEGIHSTVIANVEEAEELCDALGELTGKTLERPTAHSIGKLFQKCLTGKPAWIKDTGNIAAIAVLCKVADHQANQYKVEIQESTGFARPQQQSPQGAGQTPPSSSQGQSQSTSQDNALF